MKKSIIIGISIAGLMFLIFTPDFFQFSAIYNQYILKNANSGPLTHQKTLIESVELISPTGGEHWEAGSFYYIIWNSSAIIDVDLFYSTDGGYSWNSIATNINAEDGAYGWRVPEIITSNYLVKIVSSSDQSITYTSSVFSVISQQSVWTHYRDIKYVDCMKEQGEYLLCGSYTGLIKVNKSTGTHTPFPYVRSYLNTIDIDNNNIIWIGLGNGVAKFNGNTWIYYLDGYGNTYAAIDRLNRVWAVSRITIQQLPFISESSIQIYDGTTWETLKSMTSEYGGMTKVYYDNINNYIWIGHTMFFLYRYSFNGNDIILKDYDMTYPTPIDPVFINTDKDGQVWFLKWGGSSLTVYNNDVDVFNDIIVFDRIRETINRDEGGTYPFGTSVVIDQNNRKWIGTRYGLIRYDGTSWRRYTTDDGLLKNNVNTLAVDSDNNIWIGTDAGLSCLRNPIETGVEENNNIPATCKIQSIYPNPFNSITTIAFYLPAESSVSLIIYNILGQKIRELASKSLPAGTHSIVWDGKDNNGKVVSSGTYIAQMESGNFLSTKIMTFMK